MKQRLLIVTTCTTILLSVLSIYLYQEKREAKSELYRQELLTFQNHVTGTVRAVDKGNTDLLDDTFLRISTHETFRSTYVEDSSKAQGMLDNYEQALRYLLDSKPEDYHQIKDDLRAIFNSLTSYAYNGLSETDFDEVIEAVSPEVKEFKEKAQELSESSPSPN
ncbi:hypothetical protein EQV77_06100 [Halobacillus fulvus]|nr:hypothetical protein EQV77_06100 [Halobacillus fulvus]